MDCLGYTNLNWNYRIKFYDKKFNKQHWMKIIEYYFKISGIIIIEMQHIGFCNYKMSVSNPSLLLPKNPFLLFL